MLFHFVLSFLNQTPSADLGEPGSFFEKISQLAKMVRDSGQVSLRIKMKINDLGRRRLETDSEIAKQLRTFFQRSSSSEDFLVQKDFFEKSKRDFLEDFSTQIKDNPHFPISLGFLSKTQRFLVFFGFSEESGEFFSSSEGLPSGIWTCVSEAFRIKKNTKAQVLQASLFSLSSCSLNESSFLTFKWFQQMGASFLSWKMAFCFGEYYIFQEILREKMRKSRDPHKVIFYQSLLLFSKSLGPVKLASFLSLDSLKKIIKKQEAAKGKQEVFEGKQGQIQQRQRAFEVSEESLMEKMVAENNPNERNSPLEGMDIEKETPAPALKPSLFKTIQDYSQKAFKMLSVIPTKQVVSEYIGLLLGMIDALWGFMGSECSDSEGFFGKVAEIEEFLKRTYWLDLFSRTTIKAQVIFLRILASCLEKNDEKRHLFLKVLCSFPILSCCFCFGLETPKTL